MILENKIYRASIDDDGVLISFYPKKTGENLSDKRGKTGTACFTLKTEDVRNISHGESESYADHTCTYQKTEIVKNSAGNTQILCTDNENGIYTKYMMIEDGLLISNETVNENISQFGLNLDMNFMGKKGDCYMRQLLPTSPYTSEDKKAMYCIMTSPNGRYLVAAAKTPCDGWRIKYTANGHFILRFQFLASFDKCYAGSERKKLELMLMYADSKKEAFEKISRLYNKTIGVNVLNGGFEGLAYVNTVNGADSYKIIDPDNEMKEIEASGKICMDKFGFHTIIPVKDGKEGLNTIVWNGKDFVELFDKSCDAVKKPYHPDENLCEGGCFVWAMLANMYMHKNNAYDKIVREELDIIMGKSKLVPRRTILDYPSDGHAAWHIYKSDRVQEQFFGVSILMEAYKVYKDREFLTYAVNALDELVRNYMQDGMVFNGEDYTTVCCPMIPIADMVKLLKSENDSRAKEFEIAAEQMAAFLYKRGYSFPTEGEKSELTEPEMEDGSISCTALALLYFCAHIRYDEHYAEFANQVLNLHQAWTMFTPDARINGSSFRWWETIWEGDGQGPAFCAGHAWTIWKAEALFWNGILLKDDKSLLDSWNGYITNFCKTQNDGVMYSCYEADYIRGGGAKWAYPTLAQLTEDEYCVKYEVAHGYPKHPDNSLSRYAWARAAETWLKTAALLEIDKHIVPINTYMEDGMWKTKENIAQIYISPELKQEKEKVQNKNLIIL